MVQASAHVDSSMLGSLATAWWLRNLVQGVVRLRRDLYEILREVVGLDGCFRRAITVTRWMKQGLRGKDPIPSNKQACYFKTKCMVTNIGLNTGCTAAIHIHSP